MRAKFILALGVATIAAVSVFAQAPDQGPLPGDGTAPAVPAEVTTAAPAQAAPSAVSAALLSALQQVKSANDEMLKRQAATLQQMEELEKTAEQIKVYTKRS